MLPLSWEELIVIVAALALGGLLKGVTGVGLPLIAVPVMAGFLGVERAVISMVIPSLVLNAYQVWTHRDQASHVPEWPRLLLAGVPGAAFGATVLYMASERFLATVLAVCLVAYVLVRIAHPSLSLSIRTRLTWSPVVGAAAGALQAATGISAPIVAAYADALGLRPRAYVFAVCAPFGAFAAAHLAIVTVSRLYTPEVLGQSLLAVIPAVVFIPVGVWLRQFISQFVFNSLVRVTLIVMAVKLIFDAWMTID